MRLARAVGVESEMELAFAGLHQLCVPPLDRMEVLALDYRASFNVHAGQFAAASALLEEAAAIKAAAGMTRPSPSSNSPLGEAAKAQRWR